MTISTTTFEKWYTGNGVTVDFATTFRILDATHLAVYVGGALMALTTDYTVADVGNASGATVTFLVAPADQADVLLTFSMEALQGTDYQEEDPFAAETVERNFDYLTLLIQQLQAQMSRTFLLPITSRLRNIPFPLPGAGLFIRWNTGGTALEAAAAGGGGGGGVAGVSSLEGLTGDLTFTDDTNVKVTGAGQVLTLGWIGQLAVPRGGTGAASFTANGVLYGAGTSPLQATAAGAANSVLASSGGAPAFTTTPTVGSLMTLAQGGLLLAPHSTGAGQTGEARFLELAANGDQYVGLKGPDALAQNDVYTLPAVRPTAGQFLTADPTTLVMAWDTPGGGGGAVSGAGAANRATFWSGVSTLSYDDAFVWNNTTKRLGLGTTAPVAALDVVGTESQVRVGATTDDEGGYLTSLFASYLAMTAGAKWTGAAWQARDTAASLLEMNGTLLSFYANSGLTPGNTFTPTPRLEVNHVLARVLAQSASTNGVLPALAVQHRTTGNMTDGFGAELDWEIRDSALVDNILAKAIAQRSGGDTTGTFSLQTAIAGVFAERLGVAAEGYLKLGPSIFANVTDIGAALSALPTAGGTLYLAAGVILTGSEFSISKPVAIIGAGMYATAIAATSATINIFKVASNVRVTFSEFSLGATVTKTAGAGILLDSGGVNDVPDTRIHRIQFAGLYDGVRCSRAVSPIISECAFTDSVRAGIYIEQLNNPDTGDGTVTACTFAHSGGAVGQGVYLVASGGWRIVNNKFLQHNFSIRVNLDAAVGGVGGLYIQNNSIEGAYTTAIDISRAGGTGLIGPLIIADNEIAPQNSVHGIVLSPGATFATITGNWIGWPGGITSAPRGIVLNAAVDRVNVQGNRFETGGAGGGVGIEVNATATNVHIGPNSFQGLTTNVDLQTAVTHIFDAHGFTFAALPSAAANGSLVYCSTCTPGTSPCTGSGTGAMAFRLNGAWDCGTTGAGTLTGTGAANRIAFWTGASALGSDAELTYDSATNLLTASGMIHAATGTYSAVGDDHASADPTKGVRAVLGAVGAGDTTGSGVALFQKFSNNDIADNANAVVKIQHAKVGGTGAAGARIVGLKTEVYDGIGWGGSGEQAFAGAGYFNAIGEWGAGRQGSVQALTLYTSVRSPATNFGFVNSLEVTVANRVADKGNRTVTTLQGEPSGAALTIGAMIWADSAGSGQPIDVGLYLGNPYGGAGMYHGILIRDGNIMTGGYYISAPAFAVSKVGQVLGSPIGASTPVFSFAGDPNTGMYNIGADTLGFATGGVERLRIGSTGTVLAASTIAGPSFLLPELTAGVAKVATDDFAFYAAADAKMQINNSAGSGVTLNKLTGSSTVLCVSTTGKIFKAASVATNGACS